MERKLSSQAVYGWRYVLESAHALNAGVGAPRAVEGFLVRFEDGFGCVQPWPQFGHGTVDEAWAALAAGGETEIIKQALACCQVDGASRRAGISLWENLRVPQSHATLTQLSQAEAAYEAGFRVWKAKCGPADLGKVGELIEAFPDVMFRLDCNETADPAVLKPWVKRFKRSIDFIEDPYPHEQVEHWKSLSLNVRLAMDRIWVEADWIPVWKPGWNARPDGMDAKRTVVTSGMDHPLGQAWAAYQAGLVGTEMLCGLRTDHLFEANVFSGSMGQWSSVWPIGDGCGLGWNDELEKLQWTRIR